MIIRGLFVASALSTFALAGCATTVSGSAAPQGADTRAAGVGGADPVSTDGPPVDACAVLMPVEVTALIGANDGGKGSTNGGSSTCVWTTPAELSVTVDIHQLGTALNGLPAWDTSIGPERTLPGGMRDVSDGSVEFVAKTRDCDVQVVSDPGDPSDEGRAVTLAKVIQTRI